MLLSRPGCIPCNHSLRGAANVDNSPGAKAINVDVTTPFEPPPTGPQLSVAVRL